jgi:hypothetical protein
MSEPINRFCETIEGLGEEDAKTVISLCHMLAIGGNHADMFLPEINRLRDRLERTIEFGVTEQFLIMSLFSFLINHLHLWVEPESVERSIDANLGILEDLHTELLRPEEQRRGNLSEYELRDLIAKSKCVVPKKEAQRQQGERILRHLEIELPKFDSQYWQDWRLRKINGE